MIPITPVNPAPLIPLLQHTLQMGSGSLDAASRETAANPFAGVLEQASEEMSKLRNEAGDKVRGLMAGDGTDVHTALIATQKADLAFELALSVRNKAVGAYQQLMGMQF